MPIAKGCEFYEMPARHTDNSPVCSVRTHNFWQFERHSDNHSLAKKLMELKPEVQLVGL